MSGNDMASAGTGGVETGFTLSWVFTMTTRLGTTMLESAASMIGQISFWVKLTRKRSAGNPHAAFDVAGAGNVLKLFQWRASPRPYLAEMIKIGKMLYS